MKEHSQEPRVMLLLRVPQLFIHTPPYLLNAITYGYIPDSPLISERSVSTGQVGLVTRDMHDPCRAALRTHWCQICSSGIVLGPASLRRFKLPQGLQPLAGVLVRHLGSRRGRRSGGLSYGRRSRTEKDSNYTSRLERLLYDHTFCCMMQTYFGDTDESLTSLVPFPMSLIQYGVAMIFLGMHMEMRWARHPREFLVSTLERMIGRQARDLEIGNSQILHPRLLFLLHMTLLGL
jgi:hypothetical protein